jgi:hypothetical protein
LNAGVSVPMLNDAMEAIHEVPRMVVDWDGRDVAEIRTHLACFPASRWPGAPDLVAYFERKLEDFGHDKNTA